jgi:predicted O-linked N-acetylglucosamine transferase (SPINDLY family)
MSEADYKSQCDTAEQQLAQGDIDTAIKTAHQACGTTPEQGRAYRIIAAALVVKHDWLSALETYELSWLLDPNDAEAQAGVSRVLGHLRNTPDLQNADRPFPELSKFGYYSKACRRFLRIKLLGAAALAGELAEGESSDVLLQTAIMNIDATLCRWTRFEEHKQYFFDYVHSQKHLPATSPWLSLCLQDQPELHLGIAQKFLNDFGGHQAVISRKLRPLGKLKNRPRIGYLSADFHDHATSRLMVAMLEAHDREAWDIVGLSYGPDDGSTLRTRIQSAFETFIDLRGKPVDVNIQTLRALNLDILVDTKGLTSDFEPAYSLSRPAPVIVNFLAYPGSMGSTAYDYIIGDKIVTPFENQPYFTECIVQMPHTYQPNDPNRLPADKPPNRSEAGLPEGALVFAAFNQTKKITPNHFQSWIRIIKKIPEAVLWLYCEDEIAKKNLTTLAVQNDISPDRLIFAPRLPLAQHLARHQLADLFLDTFPCNAHTTASDALWMGLPIVTLRGKSFASRVASSLLEAMGLQELITKNQEEYEQLVFTLANDSQKLKKLRMHLIEQCQKTPLFDPEKYTKNIEQAFAFMIERSRKGKPAHAFEIRDFSEGGGVRLSGGTDFKPVQTYKKR